MLGVGRWKVTLHKKVLDHRQVDMTLNPPCGKMWKTRYDKSEEWSWCRWYSLSLSLSRSPQHERNSSFSLDVGMSHCLLAGQRKSDRFLLQFSAEPNQLIFFQEKWTSFIIDGSYRCRREMLVKIVQLSDIKSNFQMEPLKRLQSKWRMVCTTVAATRQNLLYLNIL